MRTTVTIDEDVLRQIRKVMRTEEKPFKQVLNEALRRALAEPRSTRNGRRPFRVRPHDSPFRAGIDHGKLNQLADQLDVEDRLKKKDGPAHGRS